MPMDAKKAIIIGAGSGIGKALADKHIREGHRVAIGARRKYMY